MGPIINDITGAAVVNGSEYGDLPSATEPAGILLAMETRTTEKAYRRKKMAGATGPRRRRGKLEPCPAQGGTATTRLNVGQNVQILEIAPGPSSLDLLLQYPC